MRKPSPFIALTLILFLSTAASADKSLPRATPESQGISSAAIRAFIESADAKVDTMHSFILVRHGKVIAEAWWKPQTPDTSHVMHSLSKSFTSTAIGLAAAEGKLSIDDPVLKFFPEYAPEKPSKNLQSMRIRDLLMMSTGHNTLPVFKPEEPWVKTFLNHPVDFKPGTHFAYNSPGSYMLSAIIRKTTGQTTLDYLRPRLFEPLGIENPTWLTCPQGISTGGWGLHLRTEDVARFGQLYLQNGRWGDRQILTPEWVAMATARQTSNGSDPTRDWDQGYGFQFWRCRHGAFRGDGAFGQFCVVMPEQDAVIAITADTRDMQAELNIIWDKLLPAMGKDALSENPEELARLKELTSKLAVRPDHKENQIKLPGTPAATQPAAR